MLGLGGRLLLLLLLVGAMVVQAEAFLEEEVVLYPLHHHGDDNGSNGNDGGSSWFVYGSFKSSGYLSGSEWQYIPAGIEGLMVEDGGLGRIEVTYTRGNRGDTRLPSWYVDRAPGLVVEYASMTPGDDAKEVVVMRMLGRLLGCSASSLITTPRKSFVSTESTFIGVSTTDFPCVESIEQWMKLLPCRGRRGLGGIFDGLNMVETPYHSMRLVSRYDESGGIMFHIEMSAIVHRDVGMHRWWHQRRHAGVDVNAVLGYVVDDMRGEGDGLWEFQCPVVSRSNVYVYRHGSGLDIPVQGCDASSSVDGRYLDCPMYGMGGTSASKVHDKHIEVVGDTVDVANWVAGRHGNPLLATMTSLVTMEMSNTSVVRYRQMIPWEVVYDPLSLRITHGDDVVWFRGKRMAEGVYVDWIPSAPRRHAGLVDVVLHGVKDDLQIHLNIERTVLSVFDYPPDVSRGIDIPAPVVRVAPHATSHADRQGDMWDGPHEIVVAGQNVLFHLPIPDASMPFNVACFTATLISLVFGSVIQMALWSPNDLDKLRSGKNSIKKRLVRLVIVSLIGGSVVLYIDPSSQAIALLYLEKAQRAVFGHVVL